MTTLVNGSPVTPFVLAAGTNASTTNLPLISATQTWNNSGLTATALLLNVTDTSSNAASLIADFKVGGVSQLSVRKDGLITTGPGGNSTQQLVFTPNSGANAGFGMANGGGPLVFFQNSGVQSMAFSGGGQCILVSTGYIAWTISNSSAVTTQDTFIRRSAAAVFALGNVAAASPVAQTLISQPSRAGTDSNVGGANLTIIPGLGTGTGTPANLVLNGIIGTTTGSGTQSSAAALTIAGAATGQVPSVVVGAAAIATNATDGFLYIPTCAGTPTGTPTTQTGRFPLVYDSTNHKLYIYDGGWKGGTAPGAWS